MKFRVVRYLANTLSACQAGTIVPLVVCSSCGHKFVCKDPSFDVCSRDAD